MIFVQQYLSSTSINTCKSHFPEWLFKVFIPFQIYSRHIQSYTHSFQMESYSTNYSTTIFQHTIIILVLSNFIMRLHCNSSTQISYWPTFMLFPLFFLTSKGCFSVLLSIFLCTLVWVYLWGSFSSSKIAGSKEINVFNCPPDSAPSDFVIKSHTPPPRQATALSF